MNEYKYWDIEENKKTDDEKSYSLKVVDKDRCQKAYIKWDGCTDYTKYYNGFTVDSEYSKEVKENSDYIHICEVKEMIERLQELVQIAEENFSEEDFEEYWS